MFSPCCPVLQFKRGEESAGVTQSHRPLGRVRMECTRQTLFLQLGKWFLFCESLRLRCLNVLDFLGACVCFPKEFLLKCMFLPLPLCKSAHCDLRSVIIFKTWNLSSSERVRGYKDGTVARAHVPQTSPRMAWTGASKTKVLVRPGCLHSWVVFLDSMGGERDRSVSLCPVASCDWKKP